MPEEAKRLYEEGNYGLKVFPLLSDGTYGTGYEVEGTVSVDITFSRTRTNTPADDIVDYLNRTSPETGEGTITLIGLKKADYEHLYANIVDDNGVIVGGKKNQSKRLGVIFYNTKTSTIGSSENMFVLPNCTFELPNLSTTTIAEDDTTIRAFELSVRAVAKNFTTASNAKDRYTWAVVNSVENEDIYNNVKGTVYVPDNAVLTKLVTPVVTITEGVPSWSAVSNATKYGYIHTSGENVTYGYTTNTSLSALTDGDTIQVKAIGTGYADSDYSAVQTYSTL